MTAPWITVATFVTEPEAYIAAGMLRSNGIEAIVGADRMSTLYGAGSTWAPITLSVPGAEAERATELLQQDHDTPPPSPEP